MLRPPTDPGVRALVFIDGQNLFNACSMSFGHPYVHPRLLARVLTEGCRLVGVRYYSGVPDPRKRPGASAASSRRHALMRRTGVAVIERPLRYRWTWGIDTAALGNPARHRGPLPRVTVRPYERPREKGIDLALGLDVVDLALRGEMDVAIIVSADNDLTEVARMTHRMTEARGRVRVEAAVVNPGRRAILMRHYDYTHQIGRATFERARDRFDYRRELDPGTVRRFLAFLER